MSDLKEYIEREALMRNLKHFAPEQLTPLVESLIQKQPAADVVEVVRCKDCKYWQDNNGGYPHEECKWSENETPDLDDFCSYGERKEGDDK